MNEIVNKVANSALEIFDLEDYYPTEEHLNIDLSQWLFEGFILKEKEFRDYLKNHNWKQYSNCNITVLVPKDVIIPAWALFFI